MRNLLQQCGMTLFVGPESEMASPTLYEAAFDALTNGDTICLLCETKGDLNVFEDRVAFWLRAREQNPGHTSRVHGVIGYRQWHAAEDLAPQILKACQGKGETLDDVKAKSIVVVSDCASEMLPTYPGDHRIGVCADLLDWLPNVTVAVSSHHGSAMQQPPKYSLYRGDRVFKVRNSGAGLYIILFEIKPGTATIKLHGRVADGNILVVDEEEKSNV